MSVRPQEMKNGQVVGKGKEGGLRAPLNRTDLDRAGPWLRLIAGALLIAWSGYTTVEGVSFDFAPLLNWSWMGLAGQVWVGVLVAGLLSLIQWLTSDRYPLIYAGALFLDARYTQWQIGPWLEPLAQYHLQDADPMVAKGIGLVVSWMLALVVARYGELLLFGSRRRKKGTDD